MLTFEGCFFFVGDEMGLALAFEFEPNVAFWAFVLHSFMKFVDSNGTGRDGSGSISSSLRYSWCWGRRLLASCYSVGGTIVSWGWCCLGLAPGDWSWR